MGQDIDIERQDAVCPEFDVEKLCHKLIHLATRLGRSRRHGTISGNVATTRVANGYHRG